LKWRNDYFAARRGEERAAKKPSLRYGAGRARAKDRKFRG